MKENHASLLVNEQSHSSLIVYSGAKLIFVPFTSTCQGRVFSLNSKEIDSEFSCSNIRTLE